MSSFPYSSFQVIFGRSDPRTALIFSHPFEAIYPHVISLGQELRCPIVRYPPSPHPADDADGSGEHSPNFIPDECSGGEGSGYTSAFGDDLSARRTHHHHRPFADVFEECFNEGKWLVVDSIGRVEHASWRHVGARLAVTVPSAKHHLRKHFRLFTFLSSGQDVHVYVPPILLQFALVVDTAGMVHAKSSVGPLFATGTMVDDINHVLSSRQLITGRATTTAGEGGDGSNGGDGAGEGGSGSGGGAADTSRDDTNRNAPYTTGTRARALARSGTTSGVGVTPYDDWGGDDDGRPGAMTDAYVDEVLAALREELMADQEEIIAEVDKATTLRVAELDRRLATRMGILGEVAEADEAFEAAKGTGLGAVGASNNGKRSSVATVGGSSGGTAANYDADRARTQIIEEEMARANDSFEWVYPAIHRWAAMQHPTMGAASTVQRIAADEVTKDRLLWQTHSETCHSAVWYGADVLAKSPILGYSAEKNAAYVAAARAEAALHAAQRHPHVLALHGVASEDSSSPPGGIGGFGSGGSSVGGGIVMVLEDAAGTVEQTFMRLREESRHWRVRDFLTLAQHVLRGLQYLSSRLTHRDVSARSIVEVRPRGSISASNVGSSAALNALPAGGATFKIANFQCAYPLRARAPEQKAMVPIRWSSPEALEGRFSPRSDVWGFGVLMWECLHYCCELPYSKFPQAAEAILDGEVLPCRTAAARIVYDLLCAPCFAYEVAHRPTAADLLAATDRALFQLDPHVLDRRIPMPGDSDQREAFPSPTPP